MDKHAALNKLADAMVGTPAWYTERRTQDNANYLNELQRSRARALSDARRFPDFREEALASAEQYRKQQQDILKANPGITQLTPTDSKYEENTPFRSGADVYNRSGYLESPGILYRSNERLNPYFSIKDRAINTIANIGSGSGKPLVPTTQMAKGPVPWQEDVSTAINDPRYNKPYKGAFSKFVDPTNKKTY